jgi:23S rRNA (cytidine1920-2'-O)/16S rRNA (cytidine1409-2'-O)-methyltransferase
MTSLRLDQYLVNRGLVNSRERAGELIRKGAVTVNGVVVDRPGKKFDGDPDIALLEAPMHYVSRGALKLIAALDAFGIRPAGRTCLDVGASTGGFTEVLLEYGATKVYALDAGTNQLAERLKSDPRVISIEQQNIRTAPDDLLSERVNLIVMDVSFISLTLVLPELRRFAASDAEIIALVKPQFEVGQALLGKNGIVRSERAREQALARVISTAQELGYGLTGRITSPVTGGDGNVEYLIALK